MRALPRLRQPPLRVCPHPLSRLWGRAPPDALLPHPGILPILPCQAPGGMGRADGPIEPGITPGGSEDAEKIRSHVPASLPPQLRNGIGAKGTTGFLSLEWSGSP
jgi:hypothetical protein